MERREALAALGGALGLAGCSTLGGDRPTPTEPSTERATGTPSPTPPSRLRFGEAYRSSKGFLVAVERVERRESVTWRFESDTAETGTPPSGRAYAFVELRVENAGDGRATAPWFKQFHAGPVGQPDARSLPTPRLPDVEGSGGSRSTEYFTVQTIVDPAREWYFTVEKSLDPGAAVGGWLSFVVEAGVDLAVAFTDERPAGRHTVVWTA